MTHHPIRTLPDGTRLYSNGTRYKPVANDKRAYNRRKPDHPEAVMYNREWFVPMQLLDESERVVPVTRPDTEAMDHIWKRRPCKCDVCKRPESEPWKEKARAQMRRPSS